MSEQPKAMARKAKRPAKPVQEVDSSIVIRLQKALEDDDVGPFRELLETGIDVNREITWGITETDLLLTTAASYGSPEIIRFLLGKGADPNMSKRGFTPLMNLLMAGKATVELIDLFLDAAADVNLQSGADGEGESLLTALMLASEGKEKLALVQKLIQSGADPKALSKRGWSALTFAAESCELETCKFLAASGAPPVGPCLGNPVGNGQLELVRFLIGIGADVNVRYAKFGGKETLLELVLNSLEIGKSLADFRRSIVEGGGKLTGTREEDWRQMFLELLRAGSDPNSNTTALTPLHRAVRENEAELVKALIGAGARVHTQDKAGRRPCDLIQPNTDPAILEALTKAGAFLPPADDRTARVKIVQASLEVSERFQDLMAHARGISRKNRGSLDFEKFIFDVTSDWLTFAVLAPFERVAATLAEMRKLRERVPDASVVETDEEGLFPAPITAVVEVRGNPWTVVMGSLGSLDYGPEQIERDAAAVSKLLATPAITFSGEHISSGMAYRLYLSGDPVETGSMMPGDAQFKSSVRARPSWFKEGQEIAHCLFRHLGVYWPACCPIAGDDSDYLAVLTQSKGKITRAELFEFAD